MTENIDDRLLIDRIIAGDENSTALLINRYRDFAFTLSFGILKNREDAEEVTHDSFLKALRSLKNFNRKSAFKTWLFRIVHNTSISKLRKNKMNEPLVDIDLFFEKEALSADEEIPEETVKKLVQEVLQTLKASDRALIELFYFESLNLKEISEVVNLSEANIKVKLFRIRKKMAQEIVKSHNELINQIV